jgi:hypothetical protein
MEFCSFCEISFSSGRRECPLCEANTKINDVLKENEQLREALDMAQAAQNYDNNE